MSLRLRLTALYLLLLATVLAGFSILAYSIVSHGMYSAVDERLQEQAQGIVAALGPLDTSVSSDTIANVLPRLEDQASVGAAFHIRDHSGQIVYSSGPAALDLPLIGAIEPRLLTRKVEGRRLRILSSPIADEGQFLGAVEVAQSLRQTDRALREIRSVFIFGGLGALLVTSASAYLLAGRALDPVRQLSRLARRIERTADFSQRVREPHTSGEMQELAGTFNAMIERVERTLTSQREFLADSSHELRRPLAVLRTNIDVLNDHGLPPEEREACLREMRAEAETMGRLLSDLLLLSRDEAQAIERAPVDFTSVCNEAMARLTARDDGHELMADVIDGVRLIGDKERLAQMLANLLDNAARYTPRGGLIELRLTRVDGAVRVETRDTGKGIAPEDLPHIFERFYRGEAARAAGAEGSGLGLAIVKYVAEAHGGTVTVRSEPGQGSTFSVDLPLR